MSEQAPPPPPSEMPSYKPSMDDETAMLLVRLEKKMERKIKRRNAFGIKLGATVLGFSSIDELH